jgi:hypothetical protein
MVALLASEVVLTLSPDKKSAMALRRDQIAIAKEKIMEARVRDGNEGQHSVDHIPDFIQFRNSGSGSGYSGGHSMGNDCGVFNYGCGIAFSDGSSY